MRLVTSEGISERKDIPARFSELCVSAADPIGRSAAEALMLEWRISFVPIDPALGFSPSPRLSASSAGRRPVGSMIAVDQR